jgi:hypothetical protein
MVGMVSSSSKHKLNSFPIFFCWAMWSVMTGFKKHDDTRMPCQFFWGRTWAGLGGGACSHFSKVRTSQPHDVRF